MLGKLIKHEFIATKKILLPTYLGIIVLTGVTCLFNSFTDFSSNIQDNPLKNFIGGLFLSMLFAGLIAMVLGSGIYSAIRFYKNLLGNEGYLMLSLPVSATKHMLAKLICGVVWSTLSLIIAMLIIPFVIITVTPINFMEFMNGVKQFLAFATMDFWGLIASFIVMFVVSICSALSMSYCAMAVGPNIFKNRLGGTLIAFIAIDIATKFVNLLLTVSIGMSLVSSSAFMNIFDKFNQASLSIVSIALLTSALGVAIWGVIYFFTARYFIEKKLNLA